MKQGKDKKDKIAASVYQMMVSLREVGGSFDPETFDLDVGERIVFKPLKGFSDPLFNDCIKRIDILDGTVSVDQPVRHRPNTWA